MSFPPRCAARRFPEELAELAFSRVPWFLHLHMFSMRSSAPQLLGKQDLWRLRVSQLVGASTQGCVIFEVPNAGESGAKLGGGNGAFARWCWVKASAHVDR